MRRGFLPGLLPLGGLDGRRKEVEQVSSPSTRVPKAQPFSRKRSGGELATCPGGMAPDRLRRVLAGTHSVPRRSLLTLFMEGALCGRSQPPAISGAGAHRVFRKKGGKSSILLERT